MHRLTCRDYTDVVDADLSKYFDEIPLTETSSVDLTRFAALKAASVRLRTQSPRRSAAMCILVVASAIYAGNLFVRKTPSQEREHFALAFCQPENISFSRERGQRFSALTEAHPLRGYASVPFGRG